MSRGRKPKYKFPTLAVGSTCFEFTPGSLPIDAHLRRVRAAAHWHHRKGDRRFRCSCFSPTAVLVERTA